MLSLVGALEFVVRDMGPRRCGVGLTNRSELSHLLVIGEPVGRTAGGEDKAERKEDK